MANTADQAEGSSVSRAKMFAEEMEHYFFQSGEGGLWEQNGFL